MIYSDEFIASFKDEPVKKTLDICRMALENIHDGPSFDQREYEALIETYALIIELSVAGLLPAKMDTPPPKLKGEMGNDSNLILSILGKIQKQCESQASVLQLESFRGHFRTSFGSTFCYEFSQGDMEKIQELINQLRDLISAASHFDKDHRKRLLDRLERLQSEVHKKVSDLDRFWGLIGDAGVVLGKFGTDPKPIVDRIKEIADIVWRTQSRAEELPSGTGFPMLEQKKLDGAP